MKTTMQVEKESKNLVEAFSEFIKYCKVKKLSEYTINYYQVHYKKFKKIIRGK